MVGDSQTTQRSRGLFITAVAVACFFAVAQAMGMDREGGREAVEEGWGAGEGDDEEQVFTLSFEEVSAPFLQRCRNPVGKLLVELDI